MLQAVQKHFSDGGLILIAGDGGAVQIALARNIRYLLHKGTGDQPPHFRSKFHKDEIYVSWMPVFVLHSRSHLPAPAHSSTAAMMAWLGFDGTEAGGGGGGGGGQGGRRGRAKSEE